MDLSPQTLREVAFREKLRGYHTDDVDEFVERVASGLEILQERLRTTMDRAVRAEQKAAEVGEGDDAMRRTLVLAQRTADLAIQEAKDQAGRIVAQAEAQAHALRSEAADQARSTIEDATREARVRVDRLEVARGELQADVAALENFLNGERQRVREHLSETLRHIDEAIPLLRPTPAVSAIDLSSASPLVMASTTRSDGVDVSPGGEMGDARFAELRHAALDAASGE